MWFYGQKPGAAAQMLTEAEARLARMLGEAGLKLGQFDAFGGGQNGLANKTVSRNRMAPWLKLKMMTRWVTRIYQMG